MKIYFLLENVLKDTFKNNSCNLYNLRTLINKATCYKNSANLPCICLLLTNYSKYFQNSNAVKNVVIMMSSYQNVEPKIIG